MNKLPYQIVLGKGAIGRICEEMGYTAIESYGFEELGREFVIAFGSTYMKERREEFVRICKTNNPFNIIDLCVYVSKEASIGLGNIILRNSIIASGAKVASNNFIGYAVDVDHDVTIGSHNFIGPGVIFCGGVKVGDGCLIGAGAVVKPLVKIGNHATIGAGAVVVNDVADYQIVKGVPAR